jgi:uncharacterized protein (TIGR00725 family)
MIKRRQIQIGVIGRAGVLSTKLTKLAEDLGRTIAKSDALLLFGYEGDTESVSEISARSCQINGGRTIAFLWGDQKISDPLLKKSLNISTGLARGGGREFVLIRSSDVVIAIGGGSGTLTEVAIAYQLCIPVIVLKNCGGSAERFIDSYLDERQKIMIRGSKDVESAVRSAISCVKI